MKSSPVSTFVTTGLILLGAHLVAVQMRLTLPLGKPPPPVETMTPPLLLFILGAVGAVMGLMVVRSRLRRWHFLGVLVAAALVIVGVALLPEDVSRLQWVYFFGMSGLLGWMVILLPPEMGASLRFHLLRLWESRFLLLLWVRYNIRSRYSQTLLGIIWIMILPLSTSLILTFVFSQIVRAVDIGEAPFVSFFLSALTLWTLFNQGIANSTRSLLGSIGLMNQVYFPREVLLLVTLGEALVDFVFTFAGMLLINAFFGVLPSALYIWLIPLLLVQIALMLGLMFIVSYGSVLVRDIPQLVIVVLQLVFYLTPILYPISAVPPELHWVILLNPVAALVEAFRDVIVYAVPPDVTTLYYPAVAAGVLLVTGYRFFKHHERRLADYV